MKLLRRLMWWRRPRLGPSRPFAICAPPARLALPAGPRRVFQSGPCPRCRTHTTRYVQERRARGTTAALCPQCVRPCPVDRCGRQRLPGEVVCPSCWVQVAKSCRGKVRHPNLKDAERWLQWKVLNHGSFVYRCRLCQTWHTSRSAMPAELSRIKDQAAYLIASSMTEVELAALVARWSPAQAATKVKARRTPKATRLTQSLGDLWPDQGQDRRR